MQRLSSLLCPAMSVRLGVVLHVHIDYKLLNEFRCMPHAACPMPHTYCPLPVAHLPFSIRAENFGPPFWAEPLWTADRARIPRRTSLSSVFFFYCFRFLCCFHLKHFMAFCFSRRFIMIFMGTLTLLRLQRVLRWVAATIFGVSSAAPTQARSHAEAALSAAWAWRGAGACHQMGK